MRKQVLVSVDRGETRVAILGGTGRAARQGVGRRRPWKPVEPSPIRLRAGASPSSTSSGAAGGRSSATSTRAGSTTSWPAWRPRSSTSASRRTASSTSTRSSRRTARPTRPRPRPRRRPQDLRPAEGEAGDRRAGHQGPDRDQGRAPVDGGLDPGPLPRLRARTARASASRAGCPTPSASGCASWPRGLKVEQRRPDHPHRRARRPQERHGARAAVPVPAARGAPERVEDSPAPSMVFQEADLPVRVVRDVFSKEFERAVIDDEKQHHRVTQLLRAHRAGAGRAGRAVRGRRAAVRAVRDRGGVQLDAVAPGRPARTAAT